MNKKLFLLLLLGALAGLGIAFLPQVSSQGLGIQIAMAAATMMSVGGLSAIWFFTTGLAAFKTSTKVAYYIIATGIFLFALLQLEQLFIVIFPTVPFLTSNVLVAAIFTLGPYLTSAMVMFLGVRKLAKLLGIHYFWKSIWLVLGSAILIAGASFFIPHTPKPDAQLEASSNLIIALVAWSIAFSGAGALVGQRIKNTISTTYQRPMGWLSLALAGYAIATVHEIIVKDTSLLNTMYVTTNLSIWPFVVTSALFAKAGLSFNQAGLHLNKTPVDATYLDAVIYAAQLVSNPSDVQTTLEKVRFITSRIKPGRQLTAPEKHTLIAVYHELETYLVTKEPLRKIDQAGLRARLSDEFQDELSRHKPAATPQAA